MRLTWTTVYDLNKMIAYKEVKEFLKKIIIKH